MTLNTTFDKFLNEKCSYCGSRTILNYNANVKAFINFCDIQQVTSCEELSKDILIQYISHLRTTGIKNVSVKTYIRDVKVFCLWLFDNGILKDNVTYKLKLPKDDRALINVLSNNEVTIIDGSFRKFYNPERNYCMFHLMLDCNLRSGEVVRLRVGDLDFKENVITINRSKGDKSRFVLCPEFLMQRLKEYVGGRAKKESLFLEVGSMTNPITENTIKNMFRRLKGYSGIERLHAHLLRHTFATSFILGGGSLEMLRILMGHSDYDTTKGYLHIAAQLQIIRKDVYKLDSVFFQNYNTDI